MIDNDIIKGVACCAKNNVCNECPLGSRDIEDCIELLAADALDLINRQKAEIERLQAEKVTALRRTIESAKANARAEAIKEFTERLKKEATYFARAVAVDDIDRIVKEFTEETT